jgi:acyl-CoA synthetase (AMP-forming)/AMP-acid ligase II
MALPLPETVKSKLKIARENGRAAVERVKIIARVGKQTGMHTAITLPGAGVLARELSKGKQNTSLIFRFHARNTPHKVALIAPHARARGGDPGDAPRAPVERAYSFYELNDLMDRIGAGLARVGVGPGVSVLIAVKNRPEFIMIQSAVARIGGAAVTASWRSTAPELEYLATHSGAKVIFFDAEIQDVIRELRASEAISSDTPFYAVGGRVEGFPSIEDLLAPISAEQAAPDKSEEGAVVMYTSGTTGKPKGAVRKFQKNTLASTLAVIGETPMRVGEVHLAVCPLYHATAFGFIGLSYILGSSVVVLPEFRPELFLEMVERYRVTTTAVVPTMLHRLAELGPDVIRKYDISSLKVIFSGGAQLTASLANEVLDVLGDTLFNFYGATETGIVTIAGPDDLRASPGTIGRPVPGVDIRLLDENGRDVPEGEAGELYVRTSLLIEGYHADAEATRQSMRGEYFSVGDLARRDRRGCYHIEGRKRDMIISGGVNVYPAEVEAVLDAHPAVAEVAVVGVPDREWGERVRAFVVPRRGASVTDDELRAHCRARLAGPKVPRDFVFLDALPKNPTGKILKRELRERQG